MLLIPKYGILGAGVAVAVALSLINLARLVEVHHFLEMLPYDRTFMKCIIAISVSIGTIWLFNRYVLINADFWRTLLGAGVILVAYGVTLAALKFESVDKELINKVITRAY